jgi:predicted Fe-S protein YdhL (DUF1289 family)
VAWRPPAPRFRSRTLTTQPNPKKTRTGESVKLVELGPAVVGPDGTVRRIANWDQLTQAERDAAWRRIGARNAERLGALSAAEAEVAENEQAEDAPQSSSRPPRVLALGASDLLLLLLLGLLVAYVLPRWVRRALRRRRWRQQREGVVEAAAARASSSSSSSSSSSGEEEEEEQEGPGTRQRRAAKTTTTATTPVRRRARRDGA